MIEPEPDVVIYHTRSWYVTLPIQLDSPPLYNILRTATQASHFFSLLTYVRLSADFYHVADKDFIDAV